MKGKTRRSLQEFVAVHQGHHGGRCWVCGLPERKEIDAALLSGIGPNRIVRWLEVECGYPLRERASENMWKGEVSIGRVNSHYHGCLRGGK